MSSHITTKCIEYQSKWCQEKGACGYFAIKLEGDKLAKSHIAPRVAWELLNGPIPKGMLVCHKCDNRPCINIDHLFLGTHKDNAKDMIQKGRGLKGRPYVGKKNGRSTGTTYTKVFRKDGTKVSEVCKYGHLYAKVGKTLQNQCAECGRINARNQYDKKKVADGSTR